ncbi:uncharacterized protein PG998_011194 [Apiospora kogelbergensis]|uniref:uncharacterized protein n=1 Tax=Apiospora kogelbergensis TaxID=1337665 RepID=UPI00312E07E1
MCKQYYLDFADCGCQLQYQLEHCTHGPSSSLCLGRRSVLMVAGMPLCHQHAFYRQKQEARGQELERERAERQRKLYEWQQYWQLQQGWQQNQQPGSAGQSSRGVFPMLLLAMSMAAPPPRSPRGLAQLASGGP